ncbi:hypothetical protein EV426DRAFT_601409 [Tirmania nivea]|nr:hypothetical protein EV426DRAFT_601409 [Tirmania nivea]
MKQSALFRTFLWFKTCHLTATMPSILATTSSSHYYTASVVCLSISTTRDMDLVPVCQAIYHVQYPEEFEVAISRLVQKDSNGV